MGIIVDQSGNPYEDAKTTYHAAGIGRMGELRGWNSTAHSANSALLPNQKNLNARTADAVRNGGFAKGGVQLHVDLMVGHQWKISYKPNYRVLGITSEQADVFARDVEARFTDFVEDPDCLLDVEGRRTLTMFAREGARTHTVKGEIFAKAELKKDSNRTYGTAINMIDGFRIENPDNHIATPFLKNGIRTDAYNAARGYWVRTALAADAQIGDHRHDYKYYPKRLKWGRMQMLHIFEPEGAGQIRGGNNFLSILSKMPMLNKFQDATLQNAITNALYAAVIKSDVDGEVIKDIMGENPKAAQNYMMEKAAWHDAANIKLDGQKIPHLFLNEELELLSSENPGQSFGDFESSILRDISAGLNLSYEQFSRDFSKTNYSSARASMSQSWKYMLGGRETIIKRFTSQIFALWLEEAIAIGTVKLPIGAPSFYQAKSAWCRCDWIGAGKINIDGLKEVKESVEKLKAGLSTYQIECAKYGNDYIEIFDQQLRESGILEKRDQVPLWKQEAGKDIPEAPEVNSHEVEQK